MSDESKTPSPAPPIFKWSACDPADAPPNEYLVDKLVRLRGTNLVLSAPKKGKSQLVAHIVACLVSGEPVFGVYELDPAVDYRILLLLTEETRFKVRERIEANLRGFGLCEEEIKLLAKSFDERLFVSARDKSPDRDVLDMMFGVERHSGWLLDLVQEGTYNVVVLDSLRPAHPFEENSSTAMRPVTDLLRELSGYGCGLVVHHTGHVYGDFSRTGGDAARGTSDLDAARDTAIHISGGKFGEAMVIGFHHRDDAEVFVAVRTDADTTPGVVTWEWISESDDPSEARRFMREGGILERIDAAQEPEELPSLTDAKNTIGCGYRDVIDRLIANEIIEQRVLHTGRAGAPATQLLRPGQFTDEQWDEAEGRLREDS
jgi:hypothetical protein